MHQSPEITTHHLQRVHNIIYANNTIYLFLGIKLKISQNIKKEKKIVHPHPHPLRGRNLLSYKSGHYMIFP